MPTFQKLDPDQVILGRGRSNAIARQPYVVAIRMAEAGRIELEDGDDPGAVKRLLRQASKECGVRVRSSWETDAKAALLWKRVSGQ